MQHITDKDGVTDYIFEPGKFWIQASEGFGWGWINNDGYKTLHDFHAGISIDVIMIGTSHMEAAQMPMNRAASAVLEEFSGMSVYNLGVPGQSFASCLSTLKAAVRKYAPSKYIIIEAHHTALSDKDLRKILSGTVKGRPAFDKGFASLVRKSDYLRLLYHKYLKARISPEPEDTGIPVPSTELLSETLGFAARTARSSGAKLIIAYHPYVALQPDGTLKLRVSGEEAEYMAGLSRLCAQNGIYFLDMSQRFLKEYAENFSLPYGFANTSPGSGHMNALGHRMFAEEIYSLIQRIEAQS